MCARANTVPAAVIDHRLARRTFRQQRVLVGGRLALTGQSLSFMSVLTLFAFALALPQVSICGVVGSHSDDSKDTLFTGNNHKVINNSRVFRLQLLRVSLLAAYGAIPLCGRCLLVSKAFLDGK